jgi:DNA-binding NtrC family response regulator
MRLANTSRNLTPVSFPQPREEEPREMNILVVDHETYRMDSLERGLRGAGYRVFRAPTAREAIQHLKGEQVTIHAIITDSTTPIFDDPEVMDAIREMHNAIAVVMMTSSGGSHCEDHPVSPWCRNLLEKPFTLNELLDVIKRLNPSV